MSAFNGPYGLTDIEVHVHNKHRWHDSLQLHVFDVSTVMLQELIEVRDGADVPICDAFHKTGDDLELAMQYMADLAGAMTGMEVKVPK